MRRNVVIHLPKCLKKLLGIVLWISGITAVILSILLCFAIDDSPQEIIIQGLTHQDIDRAKQLLHIKPEERNNIKHLSLNAKDLNIATGYLLSHFIENTTAVQFLPHRIWFQIALFVPPSPWGRYLDISFTIRHDQQRIYIKSFKIGEISIPDPAANTLLPFIVHHSKLEQYWQLAQQYVQNIAITETTVEIDYLSQLVDEAKQLAVQKHHDYPSLPFYQQQINEIVSQHDPAWRLSLSALLQPLFRMAQQRSDASSAIQENKAVILAVASYIFKGELRRFLPLGLIYSKEYPVFAYKRIDIPEHFIGSAMIAAVGNGVISQQLGVDKEIGDAQRGSGFSFVDINSDKSGTRFGELATSSPESAQRIQNIMAEIKDYTAFIPDPQGLQEHMEESLFKELYVSVESSSYQAVINDINHRISSLEIYSPK